ncbi:hypothetical protein HYC85_019222 [Camellia sinensis]|uniref:Aminoacyl-tRNA synthetase class Ia domain-containing protein n=1 Tax=Camellia sinensis TaxID=4442 RepID=A0A7J7GLL5_CAMSI|nr:hypothetical protein HYC85_019222 [Camellia sinensis]
MTSSHSDRCISRQRTWGVPIPVFYHVESKEPLLNEDTIDHIQSIICQKGSDAWWYMTVNELLPDVYRDKASEYEKGTDTMDAWFDSGSSWAAVLEKRSGLSFPADLYLEGTDQHRGWFQSSLLTSITTKGNDHLNVLFIALHGIICSSTLGQEQGLGTPSGWCLSLGETRTTYDPHLEIIKVHVAWSLELRLRFVKMPCSLLSQRDLHLYQYYRKAFTRRHQFLGKTRKAPYFCVIMHGFGLDERG